MPRRAAADPCQARQRPVDPASARWCPRARPAHPHTTLSGTVLLAGDSSPLRRARLRPEKPRTDPGLQPVPGWSGHVCAARRRRADPLVTTYTAPDGTFTLQWALSVGATIPLVIQLGHWRRSSPSTSPLRARPTPSRPAPMMPKTHTGRRHPADRTPHAGSIRRSARCARRRGRTSFTDPCRRWAIKLLTSPATRTHGGLQGHGRADSAASTPSQPALMTMATIDQVRAPPSARGGSPARDGGRLVTRRGYTAVRGRARVQQRLRLLWSTTEPRPPWPTRCSAPTSGAWTGRAAGVVRNATNISIDSSRTPNTMARFDKWLDIRWSPPWRARTRLLISSGFHNTGGATAATQQRLHRTAFLQNQPVAPLHFSSHTRRRQRPRRCSADASSTATHAAAGYLANGRRAPTIPPKRPLCLWDAAEVHPPASCSLNPERLRAAVHAGCVMTGAAEEH